ncbi:unnamed protein product [Amoebophrya sp. A120]|nr:unnamed protein product [Amoebophrya sp. A120]|eukprot:GSA120T00020985001.1
MISRHVERVRIEASRQWTRYLTFLAKAKTFYHPAGLFGDRAWPEVERSRFSPILDVIGPVYTHLFYVPSTITLPILITSQRSLLRTLSFFAAVFSRRKREHP